MGSKAGARVGSRAFPNGLLGELYLWLRPRRRFVPVLHPKRNVERLGVSMFRATGPSPQLELRFSGARIPQGLCRVRCRAGARAPSLAPRLLIDAGAGFREATTVPIAPAGSDERLLLVKLPPGIEAMRLEPLDHLGDFEISSFEIEELGRLKAGIDLLRPAIVRSLSNPRRIPGQLARLWALRRGGLTALKSALLSQPPPPENYETWRARHATLTVEDRRRMAARVSCMVAPPLISIVMPTYKTPETWLRWAIDSVRAQVYPHWELCIADDASRDPGLAATLKGYAAADPRIKVTFRETNGHIAAASNSALSLATGDFVAFLDHDDERSPEALFWVAEEVLANPDAALVYTDEDKIEADGRRSDPQFKCDWNYDLFLSYNMITHLAVYRTERVRAIGGLREGYEGAQDYDLALRFTEGLAAERIRHVPRVLYHWRKHALSTAVAQGAKSYAHAAATRAIVDHLAARGIAAEVLTAPEAPIAHRVRYQLPSPAPSVTLIIPTRNGVELLRSCISSILARTDYPDYDIIVIDNGSDDAETLDYLAALPSQGPVRVLRDDRPFNFSALNNRAVAAARGSVVGLLNNDLEASEPDWLREMVSHAVRPEIGAVGARLWYPDGSLQHGGVVLGIGGVAGHAHKHLPRGSPGYMARAAVISDFSAVTAACLLVRRSVYEEVGGLDEQLAVAFNDVDFCLRVRERGYRNLWTPYATLYHYESKSRGYETTPEKRARFDTEVAYMQDRWGQKLLSDPAYSPNLTLNRESFGLAWPPRVPTLARHLALVDECEAASDAGAAA